MELFFFLAPLKKKLDYVIHWLIYWSTEFTIGESNYKQQQKAGERPVFKSFPHHHWPKCQLSPLSF